MSGYLKDKFYLLKYNLKLNAIYYSLIAAMVFFGIPGIFDFKQFLILSVPIFLIATPHFVLNLVGAFLYIAVLSLYFPVGSSAIDIAILFLGMFVGAFSAAMMHNAVHGSFSKKWISILVGEICAPIQLIGFREWQITHIIYHHRYPDDPEKDPHPPLDKSFLNYLAFMKINIVLKFEKYYLDIWGDTPQSRKDWGLNGLAMFFTLIARPVLWYLLLGPKYFIIFFVPATLTVNYLYAHFNYFTHRPTGDGQYEILDLDTGFCKMINVLGFGLFFHKTHHLKPSLFNPGTYAKAQQDDQQEDQQVAQGI